PGVRLLVWLGRGGAAECVWRPFPDDRHPDPAVLDPAPRRVRAVGPGDRAACHASRDLQPARRGSSALSGRMEASTIGLLGLAGLLLLIGLRVPVGIAMGITGAIGFGLINGFDSVGFVMGSAPFQAVFPYTLSVIPLFILMG